MSYKVIFPCKQVENDFEKILQKIPDNYKEHIIEAIRSLAINPRPQGKRYKKLKQSISIVHLLAEYRLRIGPYRVLYDIDDKNKNVVLLKLIKRDEHTYK